MTDVVPGMEGSLSPVQQAPQAPMYSQAEVEQMKREASDHAFKAGFSKASNAAQQNLNGSAQAVGQPPVANMSDLQRMLNEEIDRREKSRADQIKADQLKQHQDQQEAYAKQVLQSIHSKAQQAKQEIPDFDAVTSEVDFGQIPEVLAYADTVDNGGHVLYDLAKNPYKIGQLRGLPPALAIKEVQRLSQSLKQNDAAKNVQLPNEPIGTLKSSSNGVDSGKMTVADYMKNPRYRG